MRHVAVVPPRKAAANVPALDGSGVIITAGEEPKKYKLETMDDVRLFLLGKFPTKWRKPEPSEDISGLIPLHVRHRQRKETELEEDFADLHPSQLVKAKRRGEQLAQITIKVVSSVACEFAGVAPDDVGASFMGSTGGLILAGLIHRHGEGVVAKGTTHFLFTELVPDCEEADRALEMAKLLAAHAEKENGAFYPAYPSTLNKIKMGENLDRFQWTQQARIAQGNRVFAATRASMFLDVALFQSGDSIEALAEAAMKADPAHRELEKEEKRLKKELEAVLEEVPIYRAIRGRVKGAAVSILAPILAETLTIKRFPLMGKARKFWGLAVINGEFMRKKAGCRLRCHPKCRQAFWQFGQQIVKGGAEEFWCERFATNKAMYQERHPQPIFVELIEVELEDNGAVKEPSEAPAATVSALVVTKQFKWVESGNRFLFREVDDPNAKEEGTKKKKKIKLCLRPDGTEFTPERGYVLYRPMHLLKMAMWRTLTEFGDWLYWFWRTYENLPSRPPRAYPPEDAETVEKTATAWFAEHPPKVPKGYVPPKNGTEGGEVKA